MLVNFFATWCIPCRAEHSFIEKLSKDKNIKVIGINYKDDSQKTIAWLKDLGNPYDIIALDKDGMIGLDWGVYGLPETFIVNKNSVITYKQVGPITKKIYKKINKSEVPIKQILLNQHIVSGIGNIYANEILFDSKISPFTKGCSLTIFSVSMFIIFLYLTL